MSKDLSPWKTTHRTDNFVFQLVDPHNLNIVKGELTNVVLEDFSITEDHTSDNLVTGNLTAIDDGSWIDGCWIRIIHSVPEFSYSEELATLVPSNYTHKYINNSNTTKYSLQSVLWSMADDLLPYHFTIGSGQTVKNAFIRICDMASQGYSISSSARDARYNETVVYEMSDSLLDILYDLASVANDIIDLDGHGRIVLKPYNVISSREPDWVIDADSSDSVVLDKGISWDEDHSDVYNREIVVYKNKDTEIIGYSDADSSSRFSDAKVGYTRAQIHQENDLDPATYAHAAQKARQYLALQMDHHIERSITCMYFPVRQGEIVQLTINGKTTKCLAINVERNFSDMTVGLTLREA